jgi:hypothetical protein
MRKHVVALLSMLGLASSSTPASAQVVKGAQPPDTKSESTVKKSKTAQEDAASKNAEYLKTRKAGGEQNASRDVVNEKIGNQAAGKHIAGVKYEKSNAEASAITNGSSKKVLNGLSQPRKTTEKDATIKLTNANAEQSAAKSAKDIKRAKGEKNASELNAAQQDANKKARKQVDQASPK